MQANKGSPGIDGMSVEQLPEHLGSHWHQIKRQLLEGTYKPQPVRRVEIPKPDGGVRKLGIIVLKHWRTGRRRVAELMKRGVCRDLAVGTIATRHGPWRLSRSTAMSIALPNVFWDWLGIERVAAVRGV